MITLIVIIVVVWTVIRIVQFVSRLWRPADGNLQEDRGRRGGLGLRRVHRAKVSRRVQPRLPRGPSTLGAMRSQRRAFAYS
jgi:hypothetical protein